MSVHYSPYKTAGVTSSGRLINRITDMNAESEEEKYILDDRTNKIYKDPKAESNTDLLKPDKEFDPASSNNPMEENTNYSPDRSYISTPAGNSSGDDITKPVEELEQEVNNQEIIGDEPHSIPSLLSTRTKEEIPQDVISYQEAAAKSAPITKAVRTALQVPESKSKKNIVSDHIAYNALFFNTVFYNKEYVKSVSVMKQCSFMEYFFPNVITHNFYSRVQSAIGQLAKNPKVYQYIGGVMPFKRDQFNIVVPFKKEEQIQSSDFDLFVRINYNSLANWFRADLSEDFDHTAYCLKLYSIMDRILRDKHFTADVLTVEQLDILQKWYPRVCNHYDQLQEEKINSSAWFKEIQYLHDLCWNFCDNPYSEDVIAECISALATEMGGSLAIGKLDDRGLMTKADCSSYLRNQLGMNDDIYMIPELHEYPVINKHGVKLAIDMIDTVRQQYPEYLKTFVKNVNQKYKELGCSFSITPDHPFAQYANQEIVDHMIFILAEGNTVVDDSDGASNIGGPNNQTDQPWYKRLDYTGTLYRDGSENKEMGPNDKPMQKPDWTQHYSVL